MLIEVIVLPPSPSSIVNNAVLKFRWQSCWLNQLTELGEACGKWIVCVRQLVLQNRPELGNRGHHASFPATTVTQLTSGSDLPISSIKERPWNCDLWDKLILWCKNGNVELHICCKEKCGFFSWNMCKGIDVKQTRIILWWRHTFLCVEEWYYCFCSWKHKYQP